jgi:hypothetical protein
VWESELSPLHLPQTRGTSPDAGSVAVISAQAKKNHCKMLAQKISLEIAHNLFVKRQKNLDCSSENLKMCQTQ